MLAIQIILILLFVLGMWNAVARFRHNDIGRQGLTLWLLFWLAAAVIVAAPDATFYFARLLGIGRGADLVVYLALVLLFFLVFRLTVTVEKQKKEITELTRIIALKDKHSSFDI